MYQKQFIQHEYIQLKKNISINSIQFNSLQMHLFTIRLPSHNLPGENHTTPHIPDKNKFHWSNAPCTCLPLDALSDICRPSWAQGSWSPTWWLAGQRKRPPSGLSWCSEISRRAVGSGQMWTSKRGLVDDKVNIYFVYMM